MRRIHLAVRVDLEHLIQFQAVQFVMQREAAALTTAVQDLLEQGAIAELARIQMVEEARLQQPQQLHLLLRTGVVAVVVVPVQAQLGRRLVQTVALES
jgi:hypothetical protein